MPLLLAGCAERGACNNYVLFGESYTEACGLADSFGFLYFEDTMVQLLLAPGLEQGDDPYDDTIYGYIPGFILGFRSTHLYEGAKLGPEEIVALCHRSSDQLGFYTAWATDDVELEVIEPYDKTQVGGQSWRFSWRVGCPDDAELWGDGEDVLELGVYATGYDFDLYGVPPDWPDTW